MNFVFITELYHPSVGGVESRFRQWAEELVRQGHSVQVCCIADRENLKNSEILNGVVISRLVVSDSYKRPGIARRDWFAISKYVSQIGRFLENHGNFDAVVLGKWPLLHSIFVKFPVNAIVIQDWCEIRTGFSWSIIYRLMSNGKTRKHIGIHAGITKILNERFKVDANRLSVIGSSPTFDAVEEVSSRKKNKKIVFVGRLQEHKQPLLAAQAFASAKLHDKGFTLEIVGDGPLLDAINEYCVNLPGVTVHGHVTNQKKRELLEESSLLVITSIREGFPVVLAEAAVVGTPTLTIEAKDNGTAYVVKELACGWVVGPDEASVGDAIEKYGDINNADWRFASRNAREAARQKLSESAAVRALIGFAKKN